MTATLRPGTDADAPGVIALIERCWDEYPGLVFDLDGELPELRAPAAHFSAQSGALWVAEDADGIVGTVATRPLREDGAWEVCRMYVSASARGGGTAHRLLDAAEAHARDAGAERLVLWTDTRFNAAHAFYEKRSYLRQGAIRILDDRSRSLEFRYAKPLDGIEALDAAAAASAERRLAELLVDCVAAGASVSYRRPLAPEKARAYWRRAAAEVAAGTRVLLGAWRGGVLLGTAALDCATSENQPHRAWVEKVLVDPRARRQGIGAALMRRIEQAATAHGRWLLTLDTQAGQPGEHLYRSLGWQEAGRIPDYALGPDGVPGDVLFFWRRLRA